MDDLRAQIERLLAEALESTERHAAELRDKDEHHDADLLNLRRALDSRDLIGQAKGIIMATMRCTADEAMALLTRQSQAENRKVTEIASEIASRVTRRPRGED